MLWSKKIENKRDLKKQNKFKNKKSIEKSKEKDISNKEDKGISKIVTKIAGIIMYKNLRLSINKNSNNIQLIIIMQYRFQGFLMMSLYMILV